MANILAKLRDFFTTNNDCGEEDSQELEAEEVTYDAQPPVSRRPKERRSIIPVNTGNVVSLPTVSISKLVMCRPVCYEDAFMIVDNLRNRRPTIVNFENVDHDKAQRVLDVLSGACYALGGTLRKNSSKVFVIAPAGLEIIGSGENPEE